MALVQTCCCTAAAVDVYRLLQAEFSGQKIGSRTYSAEGVSAETILVGVTVDLDSLWLNHLLECPHSSVQFLTLHEPNAKTFKAVIVLPVNSTSPEVLAGGHPTAAVVL